ncbi:MAG TPA: acyltransferase [Naasia sp.]|jgi:peptidoglycan/LPS O-acetylase OafA/YrhL
MDSLRGVAIILVISWHSAAILNLLEYSAPQWLITVNELFAPYRMPTLMFLSGMLLNRSLRKGLPRYLTGKIQRVLWPFALWTLVHYAVFMAPQYGVPVWNRNLWLTSYLWFLLYIFCYYVAAVLVQRVPALILVVTPWAASELFQDDTNGRRFLFLAGFFFLGRWVSENRALFDRILASRLIWGLAPVAVAFSVIFAVLGPPRYHGVLAPLSVAGILLGVRVAQEVSRARVMRAFEFVGRNSIVFYVTHFPLILGTVYAGTLLGAPVEGIIVAAFAVATGVGVLMSRLSEHPPVAWLFAAPPLPAALTRRRAPVV